MFKKLKCFLSFHDWHYKILGGRRGDLRICTRCNKTQKSSYDGMYGETIWS